MTIEEMKRLKKERGYTNEYICDGSGVPLGTVQKIFSGETKSPRYETIQALEKFFASERYEVFPGPVYDYPPEGERVLVKESSPLESYNAIPQGNHTAEDYYRLRENERVELIDGVIYNLASPTTKHQYIIMTITVELELFIRAHGGDCIPFPAPVSAAMRIPWSSRTSASFVIAINWQAPVSGELLIWLWRSSRRPPAGGI